MKTKIGVVNILDPKLEIFALVEELLQKKFSTRKLTDADVTDKLHEAAEMWLYNKNNSGMNFLDGLSRKVRIGRDKDHKKFGTILSVPQVRGALNCWRHDALPKEQKTYANTGATRTDLTAIPVEGSRRNGYFAVMDREAQKIRFFRIDKPEGGRWDGWTFVKEQFGPNFNKIGTQKPGKPYHGKFERLLNIVAAAPIDAARLYGTTLGRCYVCNRELTDPLSRKLGIGPDCRKAAGMDR